MATAESSRQFMLTYYLMLYSVLYYDYFVTLHKEYKRIWLAKWTVVKVIFLLNRYLMLVESVIILVGFRLNLRTDECGKYCIPWQTGIPVIIAAAGSLLLMLRTYAIWGCKRWVLYILAPLYAAQIATNIWLASTKVKALAFPDGRGPCMTATHMPIMDLYCGLPMLFDLVTSGLCIWRGVALKRELGSFTSSLIRNFTRHGTYYAIGTTLANATNLAFMTIATKHLGLPTVASNGGLLCTVFTSIFISRLALALKSDVKSAVDTEATLPTSGVVHLPIHRRDSGDSCPSTYKAGIHIEKSAITRMSVASEESQGTLVAGSRHYHK